MEATEIARELGRRGGLKRARILPRQRRVEIARLGAQARLESLRMAKLIRTNFDYVRVLEELEPPRAVTSSSVCDERLPGPHGSKPKG